MSCIDRILPRQGGLQPCRVREGQLTMTHKATGSQSSESPREGAPALIGKPYPGSMLQVAPAGLNLMPYGINLAGNNRMTQSEKQENPQSAAPSVSTGTRRPHIVHSTLRRFSQSRPKTLHTTSDPPRPCSLSHKTSLLSVRVRLARLNMVRRELTEASRLHTAHASYIRDIAAVVIRRAVPVGAPSARYDQRGVSGRP